MTTKTTIRIAVLIAALGFLGGVLAYGSRSAVWFIQASLAIVFGGNLVLSLWLWHRAAPDSGDAIVLPTTAGSSAAMLCGILPGVLWPDHGYARLAGWAISLSLVTLAWTRDLLKRRDHRS